ncbi:MAG TPA: glycosyltransferase family 4 protein [Chitinophagaceae bacterium]
MLEVGKKKGEKKVVTVLNGISDKYRPLNAKQDENSSKTITLIGRIKPEKGIWFFLDAISLLPQEYIKKSRFIIIGGSAPGGEHFLEKLESDIKKHSARDYIKYYSFIPDISNSLNESDIIVVPSLMRDPFPTTILEGLSAAKPVIATNNGGAIQSIKDTETGFLIEPLDKVKFADRLKQLIGCDPLRKQMGEKARQEYLKRFTLEIFETNFIKEVEEFEKLL